MSNERYLVVVEADLRRELDQTRDTAATVERANAIGAVRMVIDEIQIGKPPGWMGQIAALKKAIRRIEGNL